MEERESPARRTVEEANLEALKVRAEGHRKIARGHMALGKAIEVGNLPTKQSADNHFEAHKLISEGHGLLARADEMMIEALLVCRRCGGTKRVKERPPYERDAVESPCPDCAT